MPSSAPGRAMQGCRKIRSGGGRHLVCLVSDSGHLGEAPGAMHTMSGSRFARRCQIGVGPSKPCQALAHGRLILGEMWASDVDIGGAREYCEWKAQQVSHCD